MSTTASQAWAAVRARVEAGEIAVPIRWQGESSEPLPDEPAPFVFVIFNNRGTGGRPMAFGGGAGRNEWRNNAVVEAFAFVPAAQGLIAAMDLAESIAARLRSYRGAGISCSAADVIPIGPGSDIDVPGMKSPVSAYQCAVCEVQLTFDHVG